MAQSILDIIKSQVVSATANSNVDIPSSVKDKVISGLSDSIFAGIKQTAKQKGGIEQLTEFLSGKSTTAANTVSDLASKAFNTDIAKSLNLSTGLIASLAALIPMIVSKLGKAVAGKIDIGSILGSIITGSASKATQKTANAGANAAKVAGSILGSILKGKK